jgi:hypothetical protein
MNGVIGWQNFLLTGTISAASQVATLPASNLKTDQGSEVWRTASEATTAATGSRFSCDMGSAVNWRAFGIFRTNLTNAATMTIRLGTTPDGFDVLNQTVSGLVAGVQQLVYVHPTDLSARYLQIRINDAGNPDNHVDVGLAYAGPVFEPEINFAFDATVGRVHRTEESISAGGQSFPRAYWQTRAWSLSWQTLSTAEIWQHVARIDRYARFGNNLLVVPDPSSPYIQDEAVFGRLADTSDITYSGAFNDIRAWRARIVERL